MRWVAYRPPGGAAARLGVVDGRDLIHGLRGVGSLIGLLGDGGETMRQAAHAALSDPLEVLPLDQARTRSPIARPPSIRDFMAFRRHVEGVSMLANPGPVIPDVWYEQPLFYFTNPAAVIGPGDAVPVPPGCRLFDFEFEVAAVIGVPGADLTPEQAERHIAGYLIMNDWSARDLQFAEMRGPLGPCKGKDSATTLGPWFVTADELAPYRSGMSFALRMTVYLNNELIGVDRLDNMAWSFAEMAAYASRGTTLVPGDVLGSGTCGDGCLAELWGRQGFDAHPPLRPGDTVTMAVEHLGTLRNTVVAGPGDPAPLAARPRD